MGSFLHNFYFTLRRLILILVTICLTKYQGLQWIVYMNLSVASLAYIIYYHPFEAPETNALEIFNETCVLLSSYIILFFSDYVEST